MRCVAGWLITSMKGCTNYFGYNTTTITTSCSSEDRMRQNLSTTCKMVIIYKPKDSCNSIFTSLAGRDYNQSVRCSSNFLLAIVFSQLYIAPKTKFAGLKPIHVNRQFCERNCCLKSTYHLLCRTCNRIQ